LTVSRGSGVPSDGHPSLISVLVLTVAEFNGWNQIFTIFDSCRAAVGIANPIGSNFRAPAKRVPYFPICCFERAGKIILIG